MRDLAVDPPFAIRAVGVSAGAGASLGSARSRRGAFGRMLRGILGLDVPPMRTSSMTGGTELRDLSFEIGPGSAVAIAGGPGSASALLRLLAGAAAPAAGRIEMRGPVASLLEIGDNLEAGRTALENIEAERRSRRIPVAEAKRFAAEVIEFAGLQGFEGVAVRKYSTGMQMRLSLALALQGNPAVLLIGDVLGVGDAAFQRRCVDRLLELKGAGTALLVASGEEALLEQLGAGTMTLGKAGVLAAAPSAVAEESGSTEVGWHVAAHLPENQFVALWAIELTERRETAGPFVELAFHCGIKAAPQRLRPLVSLMKGKRTILRSVYPSYMDAQAPCRKRFSVALPIGLLPQGHYTIGIAVVSEVGATAHALKANGAVALAVRRGWPRGGSSSALVSPDLPWEVEPVVESAP